ncbi:hypothetical protein T439DRAFT_328305 [Meredithblackwellia eburnea MCA 4105]
MPALPVPSASNNNQSSASTSIPTSIRIATAASPRNRAQEAAQFERLQQAAAARALATAPATNIALLQSRLAVIEELSEPNSPLSKLREALSVLDPTSFDDLCEERVSEGWCPYPTCGKKARIKYVPKGEEASQLRIKLKSNGLFEADPGELGAYCSARCKGRSAWYRSMLGTERVEMLEDVEDRRRQVSKGTEEMLRENEEEATRSKATQSVPSTETTSSSKSTATAVETSLSNLKIVENTTPSEAPSAPKPGSHQDFERPGAVPLKSVRKATGRQPRPPPPVGSSAAALLPFDASNLGKTILRSSARPAPSTRAPLRQGEGLPGLPPPVWKSGPVMIDEQGREVEWDESDEEETDEMREMFEMGLDLRKQMAESGEMS